MSGRVVVPIQCLGGHLIKSLSHLLFPVTEERLNPFGGVTSDAVVL